MAEALGQLEEAIGHTFDDRLLLERAVTHSSYKNETSAVADDNERLEFLGDAVLELALSEKLFELRPVRPEGELTQLRARVVNGRTLARVARELDLGSYLLLGRGEERQGGRDRRSVLANALESVLGAVHLDGGFKAARQVVARLFTSELESALAGPAKDVKSRLQEWSQSRHRVTPHYRIVAADGPDHAVNFVAEVTISGVVTAKGEGRSKKLAQQAAARAAADALELEM